MWKLDPITQKRFKAFRKNKLAFSSLIILSALIIFSIAAPLIANNRPYYMKANGKTYFPILTEPTPQEFGIEDEYTLDYRDLVANSKKELSAENQSGGITAVFPPIPFNPFESNKSVETYPSPPTKVNILGTDDRGRDVFARLLYGFRYSFLYAVLVWTLSYVIGSIIGLTMGYFGGAFDFVGQRSVEIMNSIPRFFLLIILISIFEPSLYLLVAISSLFGWIGISYYMRAEALRLRKLEFIEAAHATGLGTWKIIVKHLLPNALTPLITFSPFIIAGGITSLAALDYLGFGLSPPTPSWGELLNQARQHFTTAWWLAFYPSLALCGTLTLLNFVGEGLRNAFDPKQS